MQFFSLVSVVVLTCLLALCSAQDTKDTVASNITTGKKHHPHHHHGRRHHHHHGKRHGHRGAPNTTNTTKVQNTSANATPLSAAESKIVQKMQQLEEQLTHKVERRENPKTLKIEVPPTDHTATKTGKLDVNAPLPKGFEEIFARAASEATGVSAGDLKLISSTPLPETDGKIAEIVFRAPGDVVEAVKEQAANPESKLAAGPLCAFLVARARDGSISSKCHGGFIQALALEPAESPETRAHLKEPESQKSKESEESEKSEEPQESQEPQEPQEPVQDKGIEVDTAMPYGQLEPFGREDTAQELTESSIRESDGMVDQLERAEVAEEKRSVFRALTRLRGAAITSFDGIARTQTGNIDQYSKVNKWRDTHPLRHLANEESDISKWAFPDANL